MWVSGLIRLQRGCGSQADGREVASVFHIEIASVAVLVEGGALEPKFSVERDEQFETISRCADLRRHISVVNDGAPARVRCLPAGGGGVRGNGCSVGGAVAEVRALERTAEPTFLPAVRT